MNDDTQRLLAQRALSFALDRGADSARVSIASGLSNTFGYRNAEIERIQQAGESNMEIELFIDDRYGTYTTNRLDEAGLHTFILAAIESTRLLGKDPARRLPPPSRYYRADAGIALNNCDVHFADEAATPDKMTLALNAALEACGSDPRIVSVETEYSDGGSSLYLLSSNGFEGEIEQSSYSLFAEVSVKGDGDARPSACWYESSPLFDCLQSADVGRRACARALQKIGQRKIASGKYDLLLDNRQTASLLSPLLSAMNGFALQQKNSFLLDRLGKRIVAEQLTLADEPHLPASFGARLFDDEGVATARRTLIERGVLRTYFIDTYIAEKMNVEPTISTPSVVTFDCGARTHAEILASLDRAVWVTGFNGGNCNSATGDFSFGIEGFLIENGELRQPVGEMNITGNILTLWSNVLEVGGDPYLNSSRRTPSMLFGAVDFSGF